MAEPLLWADMKSEFKERIQPLLPEGGNLDLCMTCGTCAGGCPATDLAGMNPRKFLRMALLGLDEEILDTPWIWMCSLCGRCKAACPMDIDIPGMVTQARASWERDKRPTGIRRSCDLAVTQETHSSMGANEEDWRFVVEDVAEEVRAEQPGFEDLQAPMDKKGAYFFLNQNSREPVTEPDEMVPLWKILDEAGADWTYGSKGWAAENYCLFLADMPNWEKIVREKARAVDELGCKVWLNTE